METEKKPKRKEIFLAKKIDIFYMLRKSPQYICSYFSALFLAEILEKKLISWLE